MKKATNQQIRKPRISTNHNQPDPNKQESHGEKTKKPNSNLVLKTGEQRSMSNISTVQDNMKKIKSNSVSKANKQIKPIISDVMKNKKPLLVSSTNRIRSTIQPVKTNVTVFSPPSSRKVPKLIIEKPNISGTRNRTQTRTLRSDEVTKLDNIPKIPDISTDTELRPSVSFEIDVHTKIQKSPISVKNTPDDDNAYQYESEFESYESDFESGSSNRSSLSRSIVSSQDTSTTDSTSSNESSSSDSEAFSSSERETTIIPQNRELQLDSGNYDMKLRPTLISQNMFRTVTKENDNQPDSGMNSGMFEAQSYTYGNKFIQKRHTDILDKITLNTMVFELYEEQPYQCEYVFEMFGKIKGVHNHSQTGTPTFTSEVQTDTLYQRTCWVQNPPEPTIAFLSNRNSNRDKYLNEKHGVGHESSSLEPCSSTEDDIFSTFIQRLETNTTIKTHIENRKNKFVVKLEKLTSFLQKSSATVENTINRKQKRTSQYLNSTANSKMMSWSEHELLNEAAVISVHTHPGSRHILITSHQCNMEKSYHRFTICVWDTRSCDVPEAVLSCWENITCAEQVGSATVAGSVNGTLFIWDFQQPDFGTPCQLLCPMKAGSSQVSEYGGITAIRVVKNVISSRDNQNDQILTLYENSVLVTWMLTKCSQIDYDTGHSQNFSVLFHNTRFKLIQKTVLELVPFLQRSITTSATSRICNEPHDYAMRNRILSNPLQSEYSHSEMFVHQGKAIILSGNHITIVNCLEQKCSLILKNQGIMARSKQHPDKTELIFSLSLDNTLKVVKIPGIKTISTRENSTKTHTTNGSYVKSKVNTALSNKSCAIQNIVEKERELYCNSNVLHAALHTELSSNGSSNNQNDRHNVVGTEKMRFHHNQMFYQKHWDVLNKSIFFLEKDILCVEIENKIKIISLTSGRNDSLFDYVNIDLDSHRLVGTLNKRVVTIANGRIFLHDINR
ncbi:uncharacterized protein LOC129767200 [Toxorhynchites rutilus septentrionalis]|uniref:uncharacterized protein LOC129767200 n=1 Tax=Toxorhynchites rutilus septentrionalis TaxID=329112 RepID=UPI00247AAE54|nr:uncharacterized protein LOC129767200 [Toxorhynchites rutilus septentrionalis]XP_055623816.1 uncharacterized protein LOC129767200 [Toxorhynchites rutilus septentrionalis]